MPVEPRINPNVRASTDADMAVIHAWLTEQERREVHGTFLCNWSLTQKVHQRGEMLVYEDPSTREPVAYQWGGLVRPGILEVREDLRGQGIGQALVEHRLALAEEAGEDILCIQCKPSSSIPFWQRMGFQVQEGQRNEAYAYRLMPRKLELPEDGEAAQVLVEWFPERRKWDARTPPSAVQRIAAKRLEDEVFLAERAVSIDKLEASDTVVRVTVDGAEWYFGKAKYPSAEDAGIERCTNGFYIDSVCQPDARD